MPDTADPTFYRSPSAAIAAPPERLAYVAAFDPAGEQRDAMTVVDCDAGSSTYGEVVGWTELPTAGNELHHFGWNACSSALCHEGHERHARAPLSDRAGDPLVAHLRARHPARPAPADGGAHDRARGARREGRLLAPPHGALRAGRHLHVQSRRRRRRRWARRRGADRPRHVRGHRRLGDRPRRPVLRLRRLVAPQRRRRHHLGVGDPVDDRGRPQPRGPARQALRPPPRLLEPVRGQAAPARRPRRRAPDGARAEAGARSAPDVGVRRRGDQRRGPVRVGVDVAPGRTIAGRRRR